MTPNAEIAEPRGMTIALISPNDLHRYAITQVLPRGQHGRVSEFNSYLDSHQDMSPLLGRNFDIAIVDLDVDPEAALRLVENICTRGSATVMVFSEDSHPDMLLRCMHAGAREFLRLPLTKEEMASSLAWVAERIPTIGTGKKAQGGLFAFLGCKGGVGVTTLATNFAVSLAQESRKRTLLIDLNLPLGDAAINLGIKAQFSTGDALQNSARLDEEFLATLLVQHSSGLQVLAAPTELVPIHAPNDAVDRLLTVARQAFEYVVVDAGSGLELYQTSHLNECASIYLVTQIGVPDLRNANRLVSMFSTKGGPNVEVVINRYDLRFAGISEEHVTRALTTPAKWKIPNNYPEVLRMQNSAVPLVSEDSPISQVIKRMARGVCGIPEPPAKKKWLGLFG